ncbi:hypothetical protein GCM10010470_49690 [Saccharopolyspora taberi]|uniref:Uncharacterized protein n=1 Tax=Saccharopolyspora taberi TaxID=60895 RepID=A0ABN3VJP9_9PSEU
MLGSSGSPANGSGGNGSCGTARTLPALSSAAVQGRTTGWLNSCAVRHIRARAERVLPGRRTWARPAVSIIGESPPPNPQPRIGTPITARTLRLWTRSLKEGTPPP